MANAPCNGCTACCHADQPRILQPQLGDDVASYSHYTLPNGLSALQTKPNGDCIYLTVTGCGIHARRPILCRRFDCRQHVALLTKDERAKVLEQRPELAPIFAAAQARMSHQSSDST